MDADGIHWIAELIEGVCLTVATKGKRLVLLRIGDIFNANTTVDASYDVAISI